VICHDAVLYVAVLAAAVAAAAYVVRRRPRTGGDAAADSVSGRTIGFDGTMAARFRATSDGRIVECTESFARTLGFTAPTDVIGRHIGDFYVEPPRWDRLLTGLQIARMVTNVEVSLHRRSGGVVWVLMSVVKQDDEAHAHLAGTIIDITARKRADDLLRETEALRSVANLATAAAHEINNPLNVIKGNLHLLARSIGRDLVAARVAPAMEAVKTLEAIVEKMNHVIRLERAQQSSTLPEMLDLQKSASIPDPPRGDREAK
jgi:PAS domain S-box-containing protein